MLQIKKKNLTTINNRSLRNFTTGTIPPTTDEQEAELLEI